MSPADRHALALKTAKCRIGAAWSLLGPDLREALVCRELLVQLANVDPDANAGIARWSNAAHLALTSET